MRYQVDGDHYTSLDIQPWDALRDWLGDDGYRAYLRGNAVKYLCRAGTKEGESGRTAYMKASHCLSELLATYDVEALGDWEAQLMAGKGNIVMRGDCAE
jgi:hypothetical protein